MTESQFTTESWISETTPLFAIDIILLSFFFLACGIVPAIALCCMNKNKKKSEVTETRQSELMANSNYNMQGRMTDLTGGRSTAANEVQQPEKSKWELIME